MPKTITIFCASSSDIEKKYVEATQALAIKLAEYDVTIVTGGGNGGLMAVLAETYDKLGGKSIGIMPEFMRANDWANPQIEEFVFTDTMAERKQLLMEKSDAIIALPGSIGTWEEFIEAMTLKKLGQYPKPIILYNMYGYYDPFKELVQNAVNQGFMSPSDEKYWDIADSLEEVISHLDFV